MNNLFNLKFIATALVMFFLASCVLDTGFSVTETISINTSKKNMETVYKSVQGIVNNLDKQLIMEEILDKYPDANEQHIQLIKTQTSMIKESYSSTFNNKKTNVENCVVKIQFEMEYNKSKPEEARQIIKEYKLAIIKELKSKDIKEVIF